MKKISLVALAAIILAACQQTPPNIIQTEIPVYTTSAQTERVKIRKGRYLTRTRMVTEVSKVTISGPEAQEWNMFDRTDALTKYNEMPLKDKEQLFETIARVYAALPNNNTFSSEAINTGIWKELSDKGINLSFGSAPADWHPYNMYVHPMVVTQMTQFFLAARPGSISDSELDTWQKALCNLINARPDNLTMASLIAYREKLEKAGIIITETQDQFKAHTTKVNWNKYRESL